MIALLNGTLAVKAADHIVIDVHGVGYHIHISGQTAAQLPAVGAAAMVHIHTHVREDQITLFGFATPTERALFQRLLTVANVGPKLAMNVLSKLAPHELVHAVAGEDLVRLSAIPGIGKKTAERIVVDLKDRLLKDHAELLHERGLDGQGGNAVYGDALAALCNLGYARPTVDKALAKIGRGEHTLEAMIRMALKELARIQ